ncbi:hypothetical protein BHM03_00011620, partial [Ensete ventricosum]
MVAMMTMRQQSPSGGGTEKGGVAHGIPALKDVLGLFSARPSPVPLPPFIPTCVVQWRLATSPLSRERGSVGPTSRAVMLPPAIGPCDLRVASRHRCLWTRVPPRAPAARRDKTRITF